MALQPDLFGESFSLKAAGTFDKNAGNARGVRSIANPAAKKMRVRAPDADAGWLLEPHVCRHCFGRLVSKADGARPGAWRFLCTNCGAEEVGAAPAVLCACGIQLRNHGPGPDLVDAGLRCQPNPEPSPDFPSLYVAAEPRT